MAFFLPLEERRALSQRNPRQEVTCPECGGKAERQRNGDWSCVASEKIPGWGKLVVHLQTCGARGVSLDDELIPLSKRHHEDTSVSDGN